MDSHHTDVSPDFLERLGRFVSLCDAADTKEAVSHMRAEARGLILIFCSRVLIPRRDLHHTGSLLSANLSQSSPQLTLLPEPFVPYELLTSGFSAMLLGTDFLPENIRTISSRQATLDVTI